MSDSSLSAINDILLLSSKITKKTCNLIFVRMLFGTRGYEDSINSSYFFTISSFCLFDDELQLDHLNNWMKTNKYQLHMNEMQQTQQSKRQLQQRCLTTECHTMWRRIMGLCTKKTMMIALVCWLTTMMNNS